MARASLENAAKSAEDGSGLKRISETPVSLGVESLDMSHLTTSFLHAINNTASYLAQSWCTYNSSISSREKGKRISGRGNGKFIFSREEGKFISSREEGKFISSREEEKFISSREEGKFISSREEEKFISSREEGKFISSREEGKFISSREEGKFISSREEGKFISSREEEKFISSREEGKCVSSWICRHEISYWRKRTRPLLSATTHRITAGRFVWSEEGEFPGPQELAITKSSLEIARGWEMRGR
ncbi:hypothetical protein RRG08_037591 [Elysia crispata]|uniref:Uncharacterized protein n=1 Tax=Elysia crispata TaxID=231223 RepID=A0AAE1DWG1_9GAST|nr:hypothetical protein RRG08_037591 [Elysia crispata]